MKFPITKFTVLFFSLLIFAGCKTDDSNNENTDPKAENQKPLGSSAEDFLTANLYENLTIELTYSEGFRPQQQSLDNLRSFLEIRLNKPGGIVFVENVIEPQTGAPYDTNEIRSIEKNTRNLFTIDDSIRLYIYFANGASVNDDRDRVTLGTAYLNTSIVVYEKTIQDITILNNQFNLVDLETTTMEHEFGHILGLVNIQNDDIHNGTNTVHEDPNSNRHCVIENCLMYFQTSTTTIPRMETFFRGMPNQKVIPDLDPLCIADLQAKGGM